MPDPQLEPPAADAPYWEHHEWWRTRLDAVTAHHQLQWWTPYRDGRWSSLDLADAVLSAGRVTAPDGGRAVEDQEDMHQRLVTRALAIGAHLRSYSGDSYTHHLPRWAQGLAGYIQLAVCVAAVSVADQLEPPTLGAANLLISARWPDPDRVTPNEEAVRVAGRALHRAISRDPDAGRVRGALELARLGMHGASHETAVAAHHLMRAVIAAGDVDKQRLAVALRAVLDRQLTLS